MLILCKFTSNQEPRQKL